MSRVVRAHHDSERVLVWQAHHETLARAAVARGGLAGPGWSLRRHTVVRLSLPLLLTQADWGRRQGRERIVGMWLPRSVFDGLLQQAVHCTHEPEVYASLRQWRLASRYSQVSAAWLDDVDLQGVPIGRQTLRLGLRQEALRRFTDGAADLFDVTDQLADLPSWPVSDYPLPADLAQRLAGRA
jgi:hypothetical protein